MVAWCALLTVGSSESHTLEQGGFIAFRYDAERVLIYTRQAHRLRFRPFRHRVALTGTGGMATKAMKSPSIGRWQNIPALTLSKSNRLMDLREPVCVGIDDPDDFTLKRVVNRLSAML